jgi:hypothetical protein
MQSPHFCSRDKVVETFAGKSVAIVGSGPGVLSNPPGLVDSHDVVVRINNYKLFPATGFRTDVFYSFFGGSIVKTAAQLKRDGVTLCMCKCPDAKFMSSPWHEVRGKTRGTDFRYIYEQRKAFWFCDTYVPTVEEFMRSFEMLGKHVPTTGFAAILDVLACEPRQVYLTGFDFFSSHLHNVNEPWKKMNPSDPIGHEPRFEREWITANFDKYPITADAALSACFR